MGVDFYNCDHCGEIYDDCGGFYNTCKECGTRICFYCQVKLGMRKDARYVQGTELLGNYWTEQECFGRGGVKSTYHNLTSCPYCKKEQVSNDDILEYLLKKHNLDKEVIIQEIKNTVHD